jgi:ABC-type antimicrobial peptide transport system permease subunit
MAKARTGSDGVARVLAREAARVDPDLPLFEIATVRDAVFRDKAVLDIFSTLFLCFGAGALGLTGIGLYSVVAFTLAQRTREFGVRMALGASSLDIARLVARQGASQIAAGVAAGLAIAVALTRAFAAVMDNAPRADGEVFAVIAISVACTSLVAMLVPARRAMTLGIVQALKRD